MAVLLMSITVSTGWAVVGGLALVLVLLFLLAGVFGPMPRYTISNQGDVSDNDSEMFLNVLESLTDAKINRAGALEVFTNGPYFYPAALDAMRSARQSICLEAYIFQRSEIGRLYLEVMTERAQAGVQVNVVLDAFGSMGAKKAFFKPLLDAGGRMELYNKPRWYSLARVDNRTHRELLIVDGRVGFIGGAGVADQWFKGSGKNPRWRDTMVRVEGDAVPSLLATFAENWLTSHGELLAGPRYFPAIHCPEKTVAMVINSTPTPGGSTRARVLFQMLLASAERTISITTPYFLPDKGLVRVSRMTRASASSNSIRKRNEDKMRTEPPARGHLYCARYRIGNHQHHPRPHPAARGPGRYHQLIGLGREGRAQVKGMYALTFEDAHRNAAGDRNGNFSIGR